jgi:hypothetical protein
MVAKITSPKSINRALNYNEQKVNAGKAECLYAGNYLKEANELNFYEKLHRFEFQNSLNMAKTNTLHISLNFDAKDKLSREKCIEIASNYMEKIGFGGQPYLVYQHHDAGHAHMHIVTSTIQNDGKRINTFNIGKNESQAARKALEVEFNLTPAQRQNRILKEDQISQTFEHRMISAERVHYGKMETKRAIQNVLDVVINQYKYSSMAELNAVLRQCNVMADSGTEESFVYQKKGLYYRALDETGNKIGVPIKASLFYQKPTLNFLNEQFNLNASLKPPLKQHVKVAIDWALQGKTLTLSSLEKALQKEGIQTVIRRNEQGLVYGITYIDYKNKVVFNGSDLGKEYSAKGVIERLAQKSIKRLEPSLLSRPKTTNSLIHKRGEQKDFAGEKEKNPELEKAIQKIMSPVKENNFLPYHLLQKKRRKKKSPLH